MGGGNLFLEALALLLLVANCWLCYVIYLIIYSIYSFSILIREWLGKQLKEFIQEELKGIYSINEKMAQSSPPHQRHLDNLCGGGNLNSARHIG